MRRAKMGATHGKMREGECARCTLARSGGGIAQFHEAGAVVSGAEVRVGERPILLPKDRNVYLRLVQTIAAMGVPLVVWFSPLPMAVDAKAALAISAFIILAWITELMEYATAGLIGLFLFWFFQTAKPAVIFSGFVSDASWFYIGAVLLGTMATKSGLPHRITRFVVAHVGLTYARLLFGIILIDFLLTFILPSGVARIVIMAPICIGVVNLFGVDRGSNIGRGIFLAMTYNSVFFDKMIIAGNSAIVARNLIEGIGGAHVTYSFWLIAFLPAAAIMIVSSWFLNLWLFPPEVASLEKRRDEVMAHFSTVAPWSGDTAKCALLILLALALWLTDSFHGISAAVVALGVGLIGMLPFVDVLDGRDLRKLNFLPFFFVAAALGMSAVLSATGALSVVTNAFMDNIEGLLQSKLVAVPVMYWTAFIYHFFTASEISMLATSLPILMRYSRDHGLDPLWIGMVWSFSATGKLFVYQAAPLVVGYSYGYFRHFDLVKLGVLMTVAGFVALYVSTILYWPLLGF